jgi:polysaccharide biosynthesis/export protein
MRNIRFIFAVGFCVACTAIAHYSQATAEPVKPVSSETSVASATMKNDRYRIGFQDILDIQVLKHPTYNQRVPVSPNGTIQLLPISRQITAVCKTEGELADDIRAAYMEKNLRNPLITVSVAEQRSQSVSITGSVEKPQTFFINRRIHLLELLALAGGPNKEAGTKLFVARSGSSSNCKEPGEPTSDEIDVFSFKIRNILEGKQTFWMKPGDAVYVQDADIIYVYGNVNKPGSFKVREPLTLMQAIISAEGLKRATKKDKIRVLRTVEGSLERVELIFDMNQIEKNKINDPYLMPNDIVAISEDSTKAILLGFADSLKNTIPNAIYRFP